MKTQNAPDGVTDIKLSPRMCKALGLKCGANGIATGRPTHTPFTRSANTVLTPSATAVELAMYLKFPTEDLVELAKAQRTHPALGSLSASALTALVSNETAHFPKREECRAWLHRRQLAAKWVELVKLFEVYRARIVVLDWEHRVLAIKRLVEIGDRSKRIPLTIFASELSALPPRNYGTRRHRQLAKAVPNQSNRTT